MHALMKMFSGLGWRPTLFICSVEVCHGQLCKDKRNLGKLSPLTYMTIVMGCDQEGSEIGEDSLVPPSVSLLVCTFGLLPNLIS